MAIEQVRIPDIGDADEVEIIEHCVAVGDAVEVDDSLIVIESDKASMEVPATVAGVVTALPLAVGATCAQGDVIAEVETGTGEAAAPSADAQAPAESEPPPAERAAAPVVASTSEEAPAAAQQVVEVRVPETGDAGEISVVELMVSIGDSVELDQGLVLLESDKATMEVPSSTAGVIESLAVAVGDPVTEGTLVATVRGSAQETPAQKPASTQASSPAEAAQPARSESEVPPRPAVPSETSSAPSRSVYAGPAVRKLARELGVDLGEVRGSAENGRIVKEDVHAHVKSRMQSPQAPAAGTAGIPPIPEVDFAKFGPIEEEDVSRIMKAGATNLHRSWLNLPHVTQHDDADVTELEQFRKSVKADAERAGVKLTPLPFLMKAAAATLKEFPRLRGSFTGGGERYVIKHYFHIGFAVDTPDGLLVPVVRDVDGKGLFELAAEIAELSDRARTRKLKPDDMRGGVFSISSLGNIGGTGFTPIVNAPEVAILGVSRLAKKPVWDGDGFVPRDMLPLSLSYDHKAINGAEAGRFLTAYTQVLADVRRMLL